MKHNVESLNQLTLQIRDVVSIVERFVTQSNKLTCPQCFDPSGTCGEHGKGFAVVAEEVRKLSEQTKNL